MICRTLILPIILSAIAVNVNQYTVRADKHLYAFDKIHFNVGRYQRNLNAFNQSIVRNDIRRAFEPIKVREEVLHHMIELMCKRIPDDPVYMFKMPSTSGRKSKSLIMHRSDFEHPTFPNLTETYMQLAKLSKRIDLNVMPVPAQETAAEWYQKYPNSLTYASVDYDDSASEQEDESEEDIVKTNAVTETNFIRYIQKTNEKGRKYLKKTDSNDVRALLDDLYRPNDAPLRYKYDGGFRESAEVQPKIKIMKNYLSNPKIDWSQFGAASNHFHQAVYKHGQASKEEVRILRGNSDAIVEDTMLTADTPMPGDYSFFDKTEKNSVWDLPGKLSSIPLKLQDKYVVANNDILRNMTILLTKESKPQWLLTARREAHKDSDIYIARSNDPFGHSTKWQLRNESKATMTRTLGDRKKRGIPQLYSMIKCATGCDPIIYKGYGCYCGFMGSGIAVDGIDKCCEQHDLCYTHSKCPSYLEYFIPFVWKCHRRKPLCASSHGAWGGPRSCAARLCQCDLEFAICLRRHSCPRKRAVCKSSYVRMIQNYLMVH